MHLSDLNTAPVENKTICAISTPPGTGGIAVARISGRKAIAIADKVWSGKRLADSPSHTAHLGLIIDPETPAEPLDQAVATIFRAPASFTGEDVVELAVHGSSYVQQQLVNLLLRQGCSLAEPGEFTRRAFASGKMDLAEAEAVADLIASTSRASHRLAMNQMRGQFSKRLSQLREELVNLAALMELELDFSEEEVEFADRSKLYELARATHAEISRLCDTFSQGDAIRNGVPVAIIGSPNAGKSSLLNALLNDNRAIVSDIPGTTRDTIEDTTQINGVTFRFIDTAGIRTTDDTIENLGIERAWEKVSRAQIILWVTAPDEPLEQLTAYADRLMHTRHPSSTLILLPNKTDLLPHFDDVRSHSATPCQTTGGGSMDDSNVKLAHNMAQKETQDDSNMMTAHKAPDNNHTGSDSHAPGLSWINRLGQSLHPDQIIPISVTTGYGLDKLRNTLADLSGANDISGADIIVTNARHYEALRNASATLQQVITALRPDTYPPLPTDLIAQDLRETLHHLASITGAITTPDLLTHIFSRFCIGK